jgi:hypothetical protein
MIYELRIYRCVPGRAREALGAFLADPEWVAVVAKTEKDGQLVEDISSQLLAPAALSAVK